MVNPPYTPEAGDIVWLQFDPQAGREQRGHCPALVLSPAAYNSKTGLMLCCPITSQVKGYPFEVKVDAEGISGAVLVDHLRSVDWRARNAELRTHTGPDLLHAIRQKLDLLLP